MHLTENACAKINLSLHVTGRRDDGYHLLDSLVVFSDACDILTLESDGPKLALSLTGPFGHILSNDTSDDNLVLRAARAFGNTDGAVSGGRLTLDKRLPVASGIGGGSADAAATLRLMSRLSNTKSDRNTLLRMAESLGADVPVCVAQKPARMSGIGEILAPAPDMPACGMVLVNPGIGVSTPEVFRARQGAFSPPLNLPRSWPDTAAMCADLKQMSNDLEAPACAICPPVREVLAALWSLPGCRLARMSGSGATCFALFDTPDAAREAVRPEAAAFRHAGWWVHAGALLS
ncbi:4-(cytidine 5'-diphospho)-2-C-methyl-D-erythritol kinase [Acetobacter sp. AN02]|uniref:4-(cytidine 5'-diphospho)-2-C-methyl-D-erythritol kinase n=1 Tax=Acetobacter sp. AN02 TaxID=2894186 RepID=UPI0024343AE0|nr:4-(cytidine 5'-diphospho)-2-C-methyl-D-erythritol kinase [Acetobacter sp. AN02]MDG6095119.1 4-(cytidine 5'-diphospho)-2-C-methyl-D-erythritol kinase [Acetobacter sp. AN02]